MNKKIEDFIYEAPYAFIDDGEQDVENEDFFVELDGKKIYNSELSKDYIIFDWIDNFVDFFKTRKWRFIRSHTERPYFLSNSHAKPYSDKEMKEWTKNIVQDPSFISMLRIDIATKGRRDWFLSLKEIPNEIKIAIFPSYGNKISKNP